MVDKDMEKEIDSFLERNAKDDLTTILVVVDNPIITSLTTKEEDLVDTVVVGLAMDILCR